MLVVLAVIAGVAAVALGAVRGGLDEPTATLPDAALPTGPLTAADLGEVRFSLGLRGYRMDEVDAALDRAGAELAERDGQIRALRAEVLALRARPASPARAGADARGDGRPADVDRAV